MTSVAIISATLPGLNPGMLSVDLAALAFLRRVRPDARATHYALQLPGDFAPDGLSFLARHGVPFEYARQIDSLDAIYASDAILFWGDFLHARYYHADLAAMLIRLGSARDTEHALALCRRHLLFADAPAEVLAKTITFGSSMLETRQRDYDDGPWAAAAGRFFGGIAGAFMREPLSALRVGHLTRRYELPHLGVDASMLLRTGDLCGLPATDWSSEPGVAEARAAVFFGGRTPCTIDVFLEIAEAVVRRAGAAADWLPWRDLEDLAFQRVVQTDARTLARRSRWLRVRPAPPIVGDLFAALPRYRFVVTDTYHLAVNAWRLGVPAVCVNTADDPPAPSTIGPRKKQVFYSMYDALDFYVTVESWGMSKAAREQNLSALTGALADAAAVRGVSERIAQHRESAEGALAACLRTVLPSF